MQWFVAAVVLWSGGGAAFGIFGLWQKVRDDRDREEQRVITGIGLIKTQPSEPPDDDELIGANPRTIHIAPSPLRTRVVEELTWEERRARYAAYVQRFADRLDRMAWALDTDTREFDAIVTREFGARVSGPAELRCRRVVGVPALTAAGTVR